VDQQQGARNAMPLFNLAWKREFFWTAAPRRFVNKCSCRFKMRRRCHEPLEKSWQTRSRCSLRRPVREAFGSREINADRVARALEQFVLTLESSDSKFDRALKEGRNSAKKRSAALNYS